MKIACVGGGPAGLYFALLMKLRDPEHDITVFERNSADSAQGWGVTLGRDLPAELHRCDPESAREIDRAVFNQLDQVVDIHGQQILYRGGGCYGIGRRRLLDILTDRARCLGVHFEFDHEVIASSQLPAADLIVACDGANSRMRLEAGRFQTEALLGGNKYLWLGTNKVFESFLYAFVPTDSGWIWAYGYRIDAGLSTFIVECSPGAWSGLGFDTLSARDGISVLEKLFERHLDGHPLLGQVQPGASTSWLNFRTITNQRWYDGSVVLAGDAAHTTHYSIGAGTTLAIEDAIALAGHLQQQGELGVALESYERQRKAQLLRSQSDARLSARWFESLPRYTGLEPRKFATLLHGRGAPLLSHLPPRLSYRLHQATEEVAALGKLRRRVGPKAKAIYIQHNQTRPGGGSAIREDVKS